MKEAVQEVVRGRTVDLRRSESVINKVERDARALQKRKAVKEKSLKDNSMVQSTAMESRAPVRGGPGTMLGPRESTSATAMWQLSPKDAWKPSS